MNKVTGDLKPLGGGFADLGPVFGLRPCRDAEDLGVDKIWGVGMASLNTQPSLILFTQSSYSHRAKPFVPQSGPQEF